MSKIILAENKKDCCGCSACSAVCPKHAIHFKEDTQGFLYPEIDKSLCIECKACMNVCAFKQHRAGEQLSNSLKETYVAVADNVNLTESASGGLFAGFAASLLESGGIVYGCSMTRTEDGFQVKHIRVDNKGDLIKLKGSKYIQSDPSESLVKIKKDLNENREVIFSGTPCQIAGLKSYLKKDYANLYTIEIICHGVPSIRFFNDYILNTEQCLNQKITDFRFRDKSSGWQLFGKMILKDSQGNVSEKLFPPEESSYYQMFLNSYTYRENCYECPYASEHRSGDITIGDYWCIDLVHPELLADHSDSLSETRGISCLIINNTHGRQLLDRYGTGIKTWPSTYEQASKYNAQLFRPSALKPERAQVLDLYSNGYPAVEAWYQKRLKKIRRKRKLRAMVPQPLKKLRRKIISRF